MQRPGRADVVLGVDVGSTNVKVVALDASGTVVSRVRRATPRHGTNSSVDAAVLFGDLEEMVIEACGGTHRAIALAAAGVGEDGVLADEALDPVGVALAWFDTRRTGLFEELAPSLVPADDLGCRDDPSRTLVGWLWARRQDGAERGRVWVGLTDYASSRWAGSPFMSDTLAARTAAWGNTSRSWLPDRVVAALGSPDLLPPVVAAGRVVGDLVSERLRAAGVLSPAAVVVAGGHDHPVGGWGVDQLSPGSVLDSMGTAEVVVAQSSVSGLARTEIVDTEPGIHSGGTTLLRVEELARNIDWASRDPAVAGALRAVLAGEASPDSFLTSGTFVAGAAGGERPRYRTDAPTSALSRASAVLGALAVLGEQAVLSISAHLPPGAEVYVAGGWSRSPGWVRVKEAVSGSAVTVVHEPEVTAVGAALLAAKAVSWSLDAREVLMSTHPVH